MLSFGSTQNIHDFGNLLSLIALVTAGDGMLDAVRDMIAQYLLLGTAQGRPNGGYLRDHIDAVAIVIDHAGDASDLALDAAEPFEHGGFRVLLHP